MDKVEKTAIDYKAAETRKQAREALTLADYDSKQFRWYAKLQVALQYIEEQKNALSIMYSSPGVKDPHPSVSDDIWEPCCRSLQELREKQRRHPIIERLSQTQLVKIAKQHNLPLYAIDLSNNTGEHLFSDMAVYGRLVNIQNETEEYFASCEEIMKDIELCNKDDALWDDPAHRAKWTAQEITRNKKRIKEDREVLDEKLRGRRIKRENAKKRRASLSRVEKMCNFVVETRGRQRLRMVARRRYSVNLKEARVRKNIEKLDIEHSEKVEAARKDIAKTLNFASLLGFPADERDPFSLHSLCDEQILHSRKGNKDYESFINLRTLGTMDIDTYEARQAEMKGRRKSICAPERYRAAKMGYVTRLRGFENVWDLAKEKNLPPIHSTSWKDEPLSRKR